MAKIRLPPIGFRSYVRRDDERSRGKISAPAPAEPYPCGNATSNASYGM